ncbi:MAG TPA: hypothetical protein VIP11_01200 [Gemmatimonadaceae bacterium]
MFSNYARLAVLGMFCAACGGGESNPLTPSTPGLHALVSPDSTAAVDARVEKTPSVILVDASGRGKAGSRVTFRVVAGGGKLTDSVVSTDANGRAALGSWTVGPTPVDNTIEASVDGEASVRFSVSARWPRRLATSALGACAIVTEGVRCWGDNSHTEFGFNFGPASSPTPVVAVAASTFVPVEISGGFGHHFCGIGADRRGVCWGRNDFGQAAATPFRLTGIAAAPLSRLWSTLSVGRITTCGVVTDGDGLCWGPNQRGEIGNPATAPGAAANPNPTLVIANGVRFKQISAGWQHACGLSTEGVVYCWGNNLDGQLGISARDSIHSTPTAIESSERFTSIAAAARHTCGITIDRRAFCWGQNAYGQLGDGTRMSHATPTPVAGGMKFVSIATSTFFISALPPEVSLPPGTAPACTPTESGVPYCWAAHTCALTEAGQPYCWGWNGWGQLGDGTLETRVTPTAVSGSLTLNGLALGESSTCGMRGTTVWCWGGNTLGQLGDGTTTRRLVPTRVLLP